MHSALSCRNMFETTVITNSYSSERYGYFFNWKQQIIIQCVYYSYPHWFTVDLNVFPGCDQTRFTEAQVHEVLSLQERVTCYIFRIVLNQRVTVQHDILYRTPAFLYKRGSVFFTLGHINMMLCPHCGTVINLRALHAEFAYDTKKIPWYRPVR
jgi:hypothetical protein